MIRGILSLTLNGVVCATAASVVENAKGRGAVSQGCLATPVHGNPSIIEPPTVLRAPRA
jgi:hypothetical protein